VKRPVSSEICWRPRSLPTEIRIRSTSGGHKRYGTILTFCTTPRQSGGTVLNRRGTRVRRTERPVRRSYMYNLTYSRHVPYPGPSPPVGLVPRDRRPERGRQGTSAEGRRRSHRRDRPGRHRGSLRLREGLGGRPAEAERRTPPGLVVRLDSSSTRTRRSEEHTSELQSHSDLVCRLLL